MRLSHIVTSNASRRDEVRREAPSALLLERVESLWTRADEFDAVVIATSNASHMTLASEAIARGKATVVDKPLALTAAAAQQLCDEASDRGVSLSVFHNRRWDSDTLTAARLLASGSLGTPVRLESRFTRFRPAVVDRWREDSRAGGGVLLDLGTHLVDQALHLLGPVTQVYAEVAARRERAAVDDDCFLALTHATGVVSHLWCSLAAPWTGPRLVLQGTRAGWVKKELDGQEDALRADSPLPVREPAGQLWTTDEQPTAIGSTPGDWGPGRRGRSPRCRPCRQWRAGRSRRHCCVVRRRARLASPAGRWSFREQRRVQ